MKDLTNKDYKLTKKCLEHLENFSKEKLLEEMEQLLLSFAEQGNDLTNLEFYYSNQK
jgi:hypothetical protein